MTTSRRNYSGAPVAPSFFPPDDAAKALVALHHRLDEIIVQQIALRIVELIRPALLPGWR